MSRFDCSIEAKGPMVQRTQFRVNAVTTAVNSMLGTTERQQGNFVMANQLYILDDDHSARPVTWGEYDRWEESLPQEDRCALGKRIRTEISGGVVVTTVFLMTPIGYFGRRPQLWLTMSI